MGAAMRQFRETLAFVDASLRGQRLYLYRRALAIAGLTVLSLGEAIAKWTLPKFFLSPSFRWFCKLFANRRIFLLSTLAAKFFLVGYDLGRNFLDPDLD